MVNKIVISTNIHQAVSEAVGAIEYDRLFLLTDETTDRLCRPLIGEIPCMKHAQSIVIGATDTHNNLDTLAYVWTALSTGGGSRHSLMVNLGGGMVTDLGGFADSTFKRGISYINIPTTLLSMVDASVGGKTGINFNGLKNEIGVFRTPETVIIDTAKACLDDFLCDYAVRMDDASKKNKLKMFGYVGDAFKAFVAYLRSINVDLIILAHAAEDKDGDDRIFYPSVTGQSKDLVQRIADQIGFLSYGADNSRVLHFQKNHRIVAKDTARLGDIIIPDASDPAYASAMANIIAATKKRIQERTNAQNEALGAIKNAEEAIAKVVDASSADNALDAINACPKADVPALKKKLAPVLKKLNLKFDKMAGTFVSAE